MQNNSQKFNFDTNTISQDTAAPGFSFWSFLVDFFFCDEPSPSLSSEQVLVQGTHGEAG